jgi:hypothetical protein
MQNLIMIALNVISRTYLREYKKFISKCLVDLCRSRSKASSSNS